MKTGLRRDLLLAVIGFAFGSLMIGINYGVIAPRDAVRPGAEQAT